MPARKRHRQVAPVPDPAVAQLRRAIVVSELHQVRELAALLTDPAHTTPIIVLTTGPDESAPSFVGKLLGRAPRHVPVYLLPGDDITMTLNDLLRAPGEPTSERHGPYRGAARVFVPHEGLEARSLIPPGVEERAVVRQLLRDCGGEELETPTDPAPPTAGEAQYIRTPAMADALRAHLKSRDRATAAVVITKPSWREHSFVDATDVAADLRGVADVFVVDTGRVSWAFTHALPDGWSVYGGASRVFPAGMDWNLDSARCPVFFAYDEHEGQAVGRALVSAALQSSHQAGQHARRTAATGRVAGFVAQRAIVDLDGAEPQQAIIWPELLGEGLTAPALLAPGMAIRGTVDVETGRMDVSVSVRTPDDALADYAVGDVVLGRIRSLVANIGQIELFPGFTVRLAEAPSDLPSGGLAALAGVGDVVAARIITTGTVATDWEMSLLDVDGAPKPAPSILPEGPAWLALTEDSLLITHDDHHAPPDVSGEPLTPAATEPEVSLGTVTAPSPEVVADLREQLQHLLEELRGRDAEHAQLLSERRTLQDRIGSQERAIHQARQSQLQTQRAYQKLQRALRTDTASETSDDGLFSEPEEQLRFLFSEPEEQLRFEVELAWARNVPAGEKDEWPLATWSLGPAFFRTWGSVEGLERSKVVEVLVQVLTDRAKNVAGRELHPLRSSIGGQDQVIRAGDGAACWRVALQANTPAARRLHYWRLPDGSIELSSIRLHDDIRP